MEINKLPITNTHLFTMKFLYGSDLAKYKDFEESFYADNYTMSHVIIHEDANYEGIFITIDLDDILFKDGKTKAIDITRKLK